MARRLHLQAKYPASTAELFAALLRTAAFRRWQLAAQAADAESPEPGLRYRYKTGSVLRIGRVVEVIRPVGLSVREVLHDPPCRVGLRIRWRIEPLQEMTLVRLQLRYRLNHAAFVRRRHWDSRLDAHFRRQFAFIALHLERVSPDQSLLPETTGTRRSGSQHCTGSQAYPDG